MMKELRKFIGLEGNPLLMEVEKGAIRRYADAVGDYSPLYRDEEYAKGSRSGSIIAPPGFFGWPVEGGDLRGQLDIRKKITDFLAERGYRRLVEGELGFDYFTPVYAGDKLIAKPKITDIYKRESKRGKIFFIVIEITFTRQGDKLVARLHQTLIIR